jgi:hypothetical protein
LPNNTTATLEKKNSTPPPQDGIETATKGKKEKKRKEKKEKEIKTRNIQRLLS